MIFCIFEAPGKMNIPFYASYPFPGPGLARYAPLRMERMGERLVTNGDVLDGQMMTDDDRCFIKVVFYSFNDYIIYIVVSMIVEYV